MTRSEAQAKAKALVSKMSIEEAISQLRYDAPEIKRLGIPAYNWWNEALHGVARAGTATVFPQAIGMSATFDEKLVKEEAEVCATEGRAKYNIASKHGDRDIYKGLTFWSPNINIFRDPRWGRGHETLGEDPVLTSTLGKAFVEGLQGDGETMKAAACAKHFAVHSGPEDLRHKFNAIVSKKDLEETYLPAFETLVKDAKVEAVMGAYNRTLDEPCCASNLLMNDILRGRWGFEGHYVSDCWAIRDFHEHHGVTKSPVESAALALKTGCDVNCGCTYRYLMDAYEQGLVSKADIKKSVIRLFTTRYLLGLMEGSEFDNIGLEEIEKKEHIALSEKAARESCVLLKNDGILPIKDSVKTIAVIGPNSDSRKALKGNYYGTSSINITVLEGIRMVKDDVRIFYSEGCDISKNRVENLAKCDDRISEAVAMAESADLTICVVGLNENLEGEEGDQSNDYASGDKKNLLLPDSQRKLLKALGETKKPLVIILLAGSSIDIEESIDDANALLVGWYPGAMGGKAIADILFGNVSPSGKLPVTFYHNSDLEKMPSFVDYSMKDRTYRYIPFEPLYPFGYGLTYSKCEVINTTVEETSDSYIFKGFVENSGSYDTDEVVQVYTQNENSSFAPLNARLVGFKRISTKKGDKTEFSITVAKEKTMVYNLEGEKIFDGKSVFFVGLCQPNEQSQKLSGTKTIKITL